jgi:hypothetical protein
MHIEDGNVASNKGKVATRYVKFSQFCISWFLSFCSAFRCFECVVKRSIFVLLSDALSVWSSAVSLWLNAVSLWLSAVSLVERSVCVVKRSFVGAILCCLLGCGLCL